MLQPAPQVFEGLCALFELFLLHVFASLSGVRLAELIGDRPLARVSCNRDDCIFAEMY